MNSIENDPRIMKARELLKACQESPGGHMTAYFVKEIERLVRDAGGTFFDIGTTAEKLRELGGNEIQAQ
jgi:histidinol phosphatase-like PHP family hydrolase